ncbi:MAG: hypothetical protein ABIR28_08140 [Vicinamibacteria bacterium]
MKRNDDPTLNVQPDGSQSAPDSIASPVHTPREDVDAISEDDPPEQKESDFVLPSADAVMPDADKAQEKWKQEMLDVASLWPLLTEDDLTQLEAHRKSLSDLVQKRYSISRSETERQVSAFIQDHQTFAL